METSLDIDPGKSKINGRHMPKAAGAIKKDKHFIISETINRENPFEVLICFPSYSVLLPPPYGARVTLPAGWPAGKQALIERLSTER
jgi:hypothetical protein